MKQIFLVAAAMIGMASLFAPGAWASERVTYLLTEAEERLIPQDGVGLNRIGVVASMTAGEAMEKSAEAFAPVMERICATYDILKSKDGAAAEQWRAGAVAGLNGFKSAIRPSGTEDVLPIGGIDNFDDLEVRLRNKYTKTQLKIQAIDACLRKLQLGDIRPVQVPARCPATFTPAPDRHE